MDTTQPTMATRPGSSGRANPLRSPAPNGLRMACVVAMALAAWVRSDETGTDAADVFQARATAAERAGDIRAAIAAYESLILEDPRFETVLAPRLVTLHRKANQPAEALVWARRVARSPPEPDAYVASVHAELGQWQEAELLLREALRGERSTQRRLPLLWQLAEVQEHTGGLVQALATLDTALQTSDDPDMAANTARRMDALRRRMPPAQTAPDRPEHGTEGGLDP